MSKKSLTVKSFTKTKDRMATFTKIFAKMASSKTKSLERASFFCTVAAIKPSFVRCEKADELAKAHPIRIAPTRLKNVQ